MSEGSKFVSLDSIQDVERATQVVRKDGKSYLFIPGDIMPDGQGMQSGEFIGMLPPEHKRQWVETVLAEYRSRVAAANERRVSEKRKRLEEQAEKAEELLGDLPEYAPEKVIISTKGDSDDDAESYCRSMLKNAERKLDAARAEYDKWKKLYEAMSS